MKLVIVSGRRAKKLAGLDYFDLSCLETMYWDCCEERFCFDKKIATYKLEKDVYTNGYTNMGASVDSVITQQPVNNLNNRLNNVNNHLNNNHLPPRDVFGREVTELPLHADKLFEVFSKSLIFRDEHELKTASTKSLDEIETKSEPDISDKPNRTKVYFEDEVNSPVTDFEIMFKDELFTPSADSTGNHDMFKIEEEEEKSSQNTEEEEGPVMNVAIKKQDVIKPSTITIKDETKITTIHPIYKYDPGSALSVPSTLSLPRNESVKGILRQRDLSRSLSARTLDRVDSSSKIKQLNSVESLKSIDPKNINKVLARVPNRSASFLNIPLHLAPEKPPLTKSKSMTGVLTSTDELRLSSLPDTPIIKSNNLPRFFADCPTLPEYKGDMSLTALKKQQESLMYQEDFSMPRYYGVNLKTETVPVHESKSMPDLRNPTANGKVSKRLVKMRSKLKPLVIKKSFDERL